MKVKVPKPDYRLDVNVMQTDIDSYHKNAVSKLNAQKNTQSSTAGVNQLFSEPKISVESFLKDYSKEDLLKSDS
jgi:hypothetical protein